MKLIQSAVVPKKIKELNTKKLSKKKKKKREYQKSVSKKIARNWKKPKLIEWDGEVSIWAKGNPVNPKVMGMATRAKFSYYY